MPASNEAVLWYCPDSAMSAACGHDHFPNVRVYETDGMIGISTVAL